MRDHGGNLDQAMTAHGGRMEDWLDLSTGINRRPYPMPVLQADTFRALPRGNAIAALIAAAGRAYGSTAPILPLAGAQAAIQLVPRLAPSGQARVLGPTYNEHAATLRAEGWQVETVTTLQALAGADLAVVVNPNNPDGRRTTPRDLLALLPKVRQLIVDESFADPVPELSLAPQADRAGLVVLRSFGKFYGLAGLRLGFALGPQPAIDRLTAMAGPWPVSGPAIALGTLALDDAGWTRRMTRTLAGDAARLDTLAARKGWRLRGGGHLFRLYETPDAKAALAGLAQHHVWGRIFPWSSRLIRLGLPGPEPEWAQLGIALG